MSKICCYSNMLMADLNETFHEWSNDDQALLYWAHQHPALKEIIERECKKLNEKYAQINCTNSAATPDQQQILFFEDAPPTSTVAGSTSTGNSNEASFADESPMTVKHSGPFLFKHPGKHFQ
jgi:hypothetical protein